MSTQLENDLRDVIRRHQGGAPEPSPSADTFEEVEKKAQEIRKADPNISKTDAIEQVFTDDRELQERYLAEMQGR